jgi:predicted TIM-barrel fold metal-dependent hydrolase
MYYIDFHTHVFHDDIAPRAMQRLSTVSGKKPFTDGTETDMIQKMRDWGIHKAVVLPIATKPTQQETINNWAATLNREYFIPFGTVHPQSETKEKELERIYSLGLLGIKLHPDFQSFFLFDKDMYSVYKICEELGLSITFHMGYDHISPKVRHAAPYMLAKIAKTFPKLKLIGAHLGGFCAWEEVAEYLVGLENVWLDTAYVVGEIEEKMLLSIIKKHGAERILYASDCPWHHPNDEKYLIHSLPLTDEEKEMIFYKNAEKLLKIQAK